MADTFDEHSENAKKIMSHVEFTLRWMEINYGFTVKSPRHDIARRLLNEIEQFKPLKEEG